MSTHSEDIPFDNPPIPAMRGAPAAAIGPETSVWTGHRGQISRAGTYLVCGLTFWLVVPVIYAVWTWLATRLNTYDLTTQRLRVKTGVINRRTDEVELYRVKDLTVSEPLFYRLYGRGNIVLDTSDRTTPVILLQAVRNPHALSGILRTTVENCRLAKGVREID